MNESWQGEIQKLRELEKKIYRRSLGDLESKAPFAGKPHLSAGARIILRSMVKGQVTILWIILSTETMWEGKAREVVPR